MPTSSETLYKASGRICLFGEHQDYLGLPIIACAINRFIEIKAVSNDDQMFHLSMPDIGESRSFSIHERFDTLNEGDHLGATIRVVKQYDCVPKRGYSVLLSGTIPVNAGLSSSSAVVVAWVRFLLHTFGSSHQITPELIAEIAYRAEVLEFNAAGGKMDPYSIAMGGMILLETHQISRLTEIGSLRDCLIVGESGISKNTNKVLEDVKASTLRAVTMLQKYVPAFVLETATFKDVRELISFLPSNLQPFFYAAVKNHEITQKAVEALNKKPFNYQQIGNLMNEHHQVLKDSLKITTPKIDAMIDAAIKAGALGAKIVGSGAGGSICALALKETQQEVIQALIHAGAKDAYSVSIPIL